MMNSSDKIDELAKALNTFRTKVRQPAKSADNPFFKSKYVQLEGVVAAIDDALEETGLSYTQDVTSNGDQVSVTTVILHESGQYIELGPLSVPVSKKDAQAFGSAETYARRYSLSAAFGITSDIDDDGNAATQKAPRSHPRPQYSKPAVKTASLDGQTVVKIKQMILAQFKAMPATSASGKPKPKTQAELTKMWVGVANAKVEGSQATSIETLSPQAGKWLATEIERQLNVLAGDHE